jgi:hypothetical protein
MNTFFFNPNIDSEGEEISTESESSYQFADRYNLNLDALIENETITFFFIDSIIYYNELHVVDGVLKEIDEQLRVATRMFYDEVPKFHLGKFVDFEMDQSGSFIKLPRILAWCHRRGKAFQTILRYYNEQYYEEIPPKYRKKSKLSISELNDLGEIEWFGYREEDNRSVFWKEEESMEFYASEFHNARMESHLLQNPSINSGQIDEEPEDDLGGLRSLSATTHVNVIE